MAKASEMLNKSSPKVKDLVGDALPPANTIELRNQYQAENVEAQTSGGSIGTWAEWLKDKGYGLVGGQAVRVK